MVNLTTFDYRRIRSFCAQLMRRFLFIIYHRLETLKIVVTQNSDLKSFYRSNGCYFFSARMFWFLNIIQLRLVRTDIEA